MEASVGDLITISGREGEWRVANVNELAPRLQEAGLGKWGYYARNGSGEGVYTNDTLITSIRQTHISN